MSIQAMTSVAIRRPRTAREIAQAEVGAADPENPVTTALGVIVTYIPTEVIAAYVAVTAVIRDRPADGWASSGRFSGGSWSLHRLRSG